MIANLAAHLMREKPDFRVARVMAFRSTIKDIGLPEYARFAQN